MAVATLTYQQVMDGARGPLNDADKVRYPDAELLGHLNDGILALAQLRPYPFDRLRALLSGAQPPAGLPHISLSIGEPRHEPPQFVLQALTSNLGGYGSYPTTAGIPQLRAAAAAWLTRRFRLAPGAVDPETMLSDQTGRPLSIVHGGQPLRDLVAV